MKQYSFLGFDTEDDTKGNIHCMALVGEYHDKRGVHYIERLFTTPAEIKAACDFLANKDIRDSYLVGFNLSYDLNNVHKWYAPDRLENRGKFITTRNRNGIKGFELMMNFFQGINLKKLSEKWLEKDVYIDIHDIKNPRIGEACLSHAKCTYLIAKSLQEKINALGMEIYLTASSTAMHYFMGHSVRNLDGTYHFEGGICKYDLSEEDAMKYLADLCYRGGNTQAFIINQKKPVKLFDVVSMYSACMRYNVFPNVHTIVREINTLSEDRELHLDKEGFAFVKVFVPYMKIPPLLVQREGKLICPRGTIVDYFTYPELRYLLEVGGKILEVYSAWEYDAIPDLFNEYIDLCWNLKKDRKTKEIGKLFMNGLSGKFGQKIYEGDSFEQIVEDEEREPAFDIEHSFFVDGVEYQYSQRTGEYTFPETSHPLISAYITGYARIKLHKFFCAVGQENVVFCDTDSCACTVDAPPELIGSKLGQWELKKEGIVEVLAPKKYRFKEKGKCYYEYVANGIAYRIMKEFFEEPEAVHYDIRPIRYRTALRFGKKLNEWVIHRKRWRGINDKRVFDKKGNSEPLELREEAPIHED